MVCVLGGGAITQNLRWNDVFVNILSVELNE